jgi:hypothetical protein
MNAKSLAQLSAVACLAVVSVSTSADAQWRRYDDRGDYGYAPRGRCLSSYGINASLARNGWYPEANVGQSPDGRVLYMRVSQGPRKFIAYVDSCTGRILQMQGAGYY